MDFSTESPVGNSRDMRFHAGCSHRALAVCTRVLQSLDSDPVHSGNRLGTVLFCRISQKPILEDQGETGE